MISDLGVKLIYTNQLPPQRLCAYLDDQRLIFVRATLHGALEAETLAHEYIHAKHRDRSRHPAIEWRAWREAAQSLVDHDVCAATERMSRRPIIQAFQKAIHRGEILLAA